MSRIAQNQLEYMTETRHALHQIPETGYEEYQTRALVLGELCKWGADEITDIAGTGIKAVFRAGGEAIAFRAELDALQMQDTKDVPYRSKHEGLAHQCGHDGHMALLLGLAKSISEHRSQLKRDVVLLFQPAEEGVGGAERMIREGALTNPDVQEIYCIHVFPQLPAGMLGIHAGPLMAESVEFCIRFHGKSAHGATPEKGIDALLASAEFTVEAKHMAEKLFGEPGRAVMTIGWLQGGTVRNCVAEEAVLEGIMRSHHSENCQRLVAAIQDKLAQLEAQLGVRCEYEEVVFYPAVVNDAGCAQRARALLGSAACDVQPQMIAEDFSFFLQQKPGVMMFLGTGRSDTVLHGTDFNFDEHILVQGLEAYLKLLQLKEEVE